MTVLFDSFIQYYGFSESDAVLAISKYREYFGTTGIFENIVYPGMEDFLKHLKNMGKTLILATSKPTVYAAKILEHFNLMSYFKFVSGSEFNETRVKKGEVIAFALEQNNITEISSAIMVGDRKHDVIGAKENGIASVGVLYGYGSLQEISGAGADFIVNSIEDLDMLLTECA
jgi:phosphoglycolate phosphatase